MDSTLYTTGARKFRKAFGRPHAAAAYAPGRVEVLGNHTDYNDGYVLSAAINCGTVFLAAPNDSDACRLIADDIDTQATFDVTAPVADPGTPWANYVKGVVAGLQPHGLGNSGFDALFLGDIPIGAGLSSSAALEISAAKALCALYGLVPTPLELARIGQRAEHDFAGVQCGLLDQLTSIHGKGGHLIMTDFRSLETCMLPLSEAACFLVCNTGAQHALVDGEYNERRANCEAAAASFAVLLEHPVTALRDVSWAEWEQYHAELDPLAARRAAHPIGENTRVLQAQACLLAGDLDGFGRNMFESHESSITYFDNSCPELDFLVAEARRLPGVLGARLSGGGFGGSAVMLVHPRDAEPLAQAIRNAYAKAFEEPCDVRTIMPSDGASTLQRPAGKETTGS